MGSRALIFILLSFLVAGCVQTQQMAQTMTVNTSVNGGGSSNISILPNRSLTPGALTPEVTQDNIQQTICISGYTDTVRPPTSFTGPLKTQLMIEYGYAGMNASSFELDHYVPLEAGGNPTAIQNLWPESWNLIINGTNYGARGKDKVENFIHKQICSGQMTLSQGQEIFLKGTWIQYVGNTW